MKHNRFVGFLLLLLSVVLCFSLTACTDNGQERTLDSISLDTGKVQTVFSVEEEFTYEGLVVTAHYSDKSTATVTDYTVTEPDMSTDGVKSVTVTYKEKTAKYDITVFVDQSHVLESITLNTSEVNKDFVVGDEFTYEGLVVTAHYSDNKDAEVTDYEVSPSAGTILAEEGSKEVTVTYQGKSANYQITVRDAEPDHTHSYGEPEWQWTEKDSEDGYDVIAIFTCSAGDDSQTITATVTSANETTGCTVGIKYTATAIFEDESYKDYKTVTLSGQHTFTDGWIEGTPASCTEGGEKGHYYCSVCEKNFDDDGETEITDLTIPAVGHSYNQPVWSWDWYTSATATFTCSECDDEKTETDYDIDFTREQGNKKYSATVTFDEQEYHDNLIVELQSISLNTDKVQKNFYSDDEFNYEHLVVTAHYEDATQEEVTEYSVSVPDMADKETLITVNYESKSATYDIRYINKSLYRGEELTIQAVDGAFYGCHNEGTFIGGIGEGARITFKFGAAANGIVALYLGAAGTKEWGNADNGYEDAFSITVNGSSVGSLTVSTGDWTNFTPLLVCYIKVEQDSSYTVVFTAENTNGQVNVEHFKITPAELPAYNGEDLVLDGSHAEIYGGEWQPGTADGIIGNISEGSSFKFTVFSEIEGAAKLTVSLAGGIRNESWSVINKAKIHVYVNGKEVILNGQEVQSTGILDWSEFDCDIELQSGINVIEFKVEFDSAHGDNEYVFFNFHRIKISSADEIA